jgi:uncharacterized protein
MQDEAAGYAGGDGNAAARGEPMTTENNRRIITDVFARLATGDGSGFWDALADDISLTTIGTTKYSGTFVGKEAVAAWFAPFLGSFDGPIALTADRIVADGDVVAVQGRGRARTKDGQDYNNVYGIFFRLSNGKIVEYTEYFDTALNITVFGK